MGGGGIETDPGEIGVAGPTGHSPLPRNSLSKADSVGELRVSDIYKDTNFYYVNIEYLNIEYVLCIKLCTILCQLGSVKKA